MKKKEFAERIAEAIKPYLPEDLSDSTFEVMEVNKPNGVILTGIARKIIGSGMSPIVYVDELYDKGMSTEEACEVIARRFKSAWERAQKISDRIEKAMETEEPVAVLVNYENSKDLLEPLIYRRVGDYAIIPVFSVENDGVISEAKIRKEYAEVKGIDAEELIDRALKESSIKKPAVLWDLEESAHLSATENFLATGREHHKIMTLTCESMQDGAIALFYPDVMDKIAQVVGGSYYIVPSSVHEVLIVPYSEETYPRSLNHMLRSVNKMLVSPEETLGDRVVLYDAESKALVTPCYLP